MPQFDAKFSLTQLQVALHQLDRAALLFLDAGDFISAITLAGAADSITGETLKARGVDATLDREKQFLKVGEASHLSTKQINDEHLNAPGGRKLMRVSTILTRGAKYKDAWSTLL